MVSEHNKPKRFVKAGYQPLEDYSYINKLPVQVQDQVKESTADFECNILIYCTPDELRSLQTGYWTLKHTAEEKAISCWDKSPTPEGHTVLTALCMQQEEKHLLNECIVQTGLAKAYTIQPQSKGKGVLNAEFIPAKLAVQLDDRLGWPTTGYFYYFVENELYQECKLSGEDRWSFYFTQSDASKLTDDLLSEHHFSSLLLPYKVEGQTVGGQYILFRQHKLTEDEFANISPSWLENNAVALDLSGAMACRSEALQERNSQSESTSANSEQEPTHYQVQLDPQSRHRESWPDIAQKHGLTAKQLLDLNPHYNDDPLKLQVGDSLLITAPGMQANNKPKEVQPPTTNLAPGKAYPFGNIWGRYHQQTMMPWLQHIQENSLILANTPVINATQVKKRLLRIGVFFDGTGQNKDNDLYKETYGNKSRSNIGRLFDAYPEESGKIAKIYVSGVGTVDGAYLTPELIDKGEDETLFAQALGIELRDAIKTKSEKLADVLDSHTTSLLEKTSAMYKWQTLIRQFRDLLTAESLEFSEVTHIEFDVFGFSRGAALARHFVNAALAGLPDYTRRRADSNPCGIVPNLLGTETADYFNAFNDGYEIDQTRQVSIRFVGLFDTVGSFYMPGNDDEGNFILSLKPDCAQKVVQLCAHHEYRKNFPLTTLKTHGLLPDNFFEEIFPGAHSDVGGGYSSCQQYDKQGLPSRYGMPVDSTFNRELVKTESYDAEYYQAEIEWNKFGYSSLGTPESLMADLCREKEPAWSQHCLSKYGQYGIVKADGPRLYFYRLQAVNNAVAGLTQERMKQQAELAGIEWEMKYYVQPVDFNADPNILKLWERLEDLPLGTITPAHWISEVNQHGQQWIHRPHDAMINPGCDTAYDYFVNNPTRNRKDELERNVFSNG
ncbi:phospholipase effector Tle1 domain-containing protein [Photobacterium halotolerans]|uniref:phospholipase effector Tle1 domain-containing protein n=1 Tax=Photobacterium halotolerans TaxID=265726 RepID=UPI0013737054|nr:DUF2235 domain-containing protein [Photobacterium halotolerans]NAW86352.1 DUF2235 domain-containing protein [Photobacterium halotolerans]